MGSPRSAHQPEVAYHAGVHFRSRRTVKLRVQADGSVINLYRLERFVSEETDFPWVLDE
jgi:hypothetical protein